MQIRHLCLALCLTGAVGVPSAVAADAEREALTRKLVDRWSGMVEDAYHIDGARWAREMQPAFELASLEELRAAAKATDFQAMNNALLPPAQGALSSLGADAARTKVFGDADRDLVFVPVTPCRILDTRIAGGAIAAGTTRGFDVTSIATYASQGGSSSNCGGVGAAGSFAAVVVNLTTVTPSNQGYITAFPFGASQPLSASLVYTPSSLVSNEVIIRLDQGASANEMSVFSSAQTHLVGDVTGYFINPGPLSYECVETTEATLTIAPSGTGNVVSGVCPAGYTPTATNCWSSSWLMPMVYIRNGTCSARNNSGGDADLRASRTCCRARRT